MSVDISVSKKVKRGELSVGSGGLSATTDHETTELES